MHIKNPNFQLLRKNWKTQPHLGHGAALLKMPYFSKLIRGIYKNGKIVKKSKGMINTKLRLEVSSGFPGGAVIKSPPANTGDTRELGSIPGSGRSPREGNLNPLQ